MGKGDGSFRPDGNSPSQPSSGSTSGNPGGYKRSGQVMAELRATKSIAQAQLPPPAFGIPAPKTQQALAQRMHLQEWRPFRIISKRQLSSDMWLFRFALPADASL